LINEQNKEKGTDQPLNFAGRLVCRPLHSGSSIIHLGFSAALQKPEVPETGRPADAFRFCSRAETDVSQKMFVDTGDILHSKMLTLLNFEAAASYGPLMLQSEYTIAEIDRKNIRQYVSQKGGYLSGAWLISGESHQYNSKQAEFAGIIPAKSSGAFELAARYSYINLNDLDAGIFGGQAENYTIGLNYYVNSNVRIMLNYNYVNQDRFANGAGTLYIYKDADGKLYRNAPNETVAKKAGDRFHYLAVRLQLVF